ncbi:MAG: cell wall hydrolase [Clostridiales bacterium]|nr:cell wall hydrolase [Clostridiales bacterium]
MKKFIITCSLSIALSFMLFPSIITKGNTSFSEKYETDSEIIDVGIAYNSETNNVVEVFSQGSSTLNITQLDIDLMAKLVYGESRGEPFEGKVAVVSVVLNRVLDPHFPNTIDGVIFQKNAFSCVINNNIEAYPDKSCYDAVYEALKGKDPTNNALFFYNPSISTCSWMNKTAKIDCTSIGHHVFFKSK